MIWNSIQAVVVIFLLIGTGILATWRKWITPQIADAFPKILINLAVPCTAIYYFYTNFSREQLLTAWIPLLVMAVAYPAAYGVGKLFAVIFRIPKTRRGLFTVLFSYSNSIFIGLPVAHALFGDPGIPYAMYYYLGNTTFFWILGYFGIRHDADVINGCQTRISAKEILKKLAIPPIIAIIVMFGVVLLQIPLPDFVVNTAGYLSDLTTPLSLIFMGSVIYEAGLRDLGFDKNIASVLFGRFLLIPGLVFLLSQLAIILFSPGGTTTELALMRNVFAIQAGLPVMTQTVILSRLYGADVKFATKSFIWTTLVSVITIPAYMLLFQYI
jgi:predicted permease